MDSALLTEVDDGDNEDTSIAGVQNEDIELDTESDHNSIDPNEDDNNSSKASVHSTGSQASIHSVTSEPPQHPPNDNDNSSQEQSELVNDNVPKLETQVPVLMSI